ncbi:MAG: hypothetical protein LBS51_08510, partial [Oscillospiraceae bacterium]|nr:hypothetical protein [Oscillospiraceae bacterium]
MKKMCQKITAILLTLVMTLTMLPVHVLATAGIPPSALPETLSATAQIGGEDYAILYSDYIAVYVRKSDGGFAVLPASETFDGTKPLSFATLRVDGREYRYGTYYEGATGEISIAPYAENGLIQSHQVIGNFTVSQYFAITRDESREGAYAVKIGYAAEYFGEGEAKAGARIALDTRFSAREYIPLVLTDIEDGVALVDTEVKIPFAPKSAAVTKEFVEAEGYDDTPNKGFILFLDDAWDDPSAVAFTTPAALELAYDYEPLAADIPLFDGSSDSAAAIYWEDAALSADGDTLALFGVNYGFTDMAAAGKGEGVFALDLTPSALDAPLTTNAAAAMMQTMAADTATVYIGHSSIPGEWFNLTASSPFAALSEAIYSDEYGSSYWDAENFWLADQYHKATISAGADFALSLTYGQNTPQLIRDAVQKYHVSLNWDGGGSEIAEAEVNIGEIFTIAGAELFSHYRPGTDENLSVNITPIITPPAGYALLVLSGDSGASSSLASSGELLYYCGDGVSGGSLTLNNNAYWSGLKYFAKTDETLTVTMQMSDLDHRPKLSSDPGIPANSPYIQWSYNNLIPPQPAAMTPVQGQTGPWVYAFTQDIPSAAVSGEIAALTVQDAAGTALYPINLIADNVSDYNLLHSALADSANVSFGQGILWGTESGTVTIDMTSLGGKTVNVYKAGTTTLLAAGSASTIIFTMPGEAVDIVIGNEYRVFTAVSGATEGVTVDFSPANPDGSTEVYAYASIFGDYTLSGITVAKGATGGGDAISTTALPGGGVKFTMPSDNDVLITASVTAQSGALHSVTVRPLAGDGQTWYDVHFWTDSNNGRLPYETDESGRIGKIRAGTIVYYALYPTTWDTDFTDIELWTVDDFTINSETPEVFAPITSGPAYFPASYSTSTQNAGFFTMPDKDVVFEVFGHKTNVAYQLKTVMEDVSGNPISGYESHVKLFNGLDAEVNSAFPGDGITVKAPWGFGDNHAFKRIYITSARETINITSGTAFNMPKGDATVHIVYDGLPTQTLSIMNPYLFTDDGNYGGEAQVLLYGVDAGANMALNTNTYSKSMYLEQDGKLKAEIALRYAPDYGYSYKLMKDGSEVSSPEVRESAGGAWVTKSYKCTLDADSPITLTVAQSGVAKTLALGDDLMPNSPNTAVFSSVSLMGGWDSLTGNYVNLKTLFEGGQSPTITKVSLVGKNGATQVYSQAQTDSPSINAAIGYPDKYRGVTLTDLGYA